MTVISKENERLGSEFARSLPIWPAWVVWLTAAMCVFDVLLLLFTKAALDRHSLQLVTVTWTLCLLAAVASNRIALGEKLRTFVTGAAIVLALSPALKILNYLTMWTSFPLADARLAAWDAKIGLDWTGYIHWIDKHPFLLSFMSMTYGGIIEFSGFVFCIVLLLIGAERAREFVGLFVVTGLVTILIGPLFPAKGAMIFYAPDPNAFAYVKTSMGTYFWQPLQDLRGAETLELSLEAMPGLVAFPSFHTVMALLAIYACRGSPALFIGALAFNGVMIMSTPLFGGHYFVDVLAGAALVTVTVTIKNLTANSKADGKLVWNGPKILAGCGNFVSLVTCALTRRISNARRLSQGNQEP